MTIIHRDYLVDLQKLPQDIYNLESQYWLMGYLINTDRELKVVKLLRSQGRKSAWLNIERADTGFEETELPYDHALNIIERTPALPIIEKDVMGLSDHMWDLTFYHGSLEGLVTSTLSIHPSKLYSPITILPAWVTQDITDNPYYKEPVLARLGI